MLNYSNKIQSRLVSIAMIFVAILALIFQIFNGNVILTDPFHHGEFFAATVGLFPDVNLAFHPLTIHGALDFLPGIFAEYLWGADNYFLPTFAIYKLLNFFAAILLILIAYNLTKYKNHQFLLVLCVVLVAPFLVGYRDLILLIALQLFLKINDQGTNPNRSNFLQILMGAVVAFGLFWSYDRGIAGALSLGAAVLVLIFRNRWYAISLASFAITFVGLGLIFKVFSFENYISDIFILMQTSGKWSYGWKTQPVVLTIFAVIFNFAALQFLIIESLRSKALTERLPIIICFGLLSLFMLKMATNRADIGHIYFSCWVPVLISFFLYEKTTAVKTQVALLSLSSFVLGTFLTIFYKNYGFAVAAGILVFTLKFKFDFFNKLARVVFSLLVVVCLGLNSFVSLQAISEGQYSWIKFLSEPQGNRLSVTDSVVWASDRLQEHAVDCIFDLTNNGVINGLLRLPSCSRFTYPIYAGANHESILINDLLHASPRAIVYSSTYWSYSIDGKDMKNRFPALDKIILENYPKEVCSNEYCVRYKSI